DQDGQWAATGNIQTALLQALLADPYFQAQGPKSTGRELFNIAWLDQHLESQPTLAAADVQATLLELTALSITEALKAAQQDTELLLVCGGGAHNHTLMRRLAQLLPNSQVSSTDAHSVPADWVEAM